MVAAFTLILSARQKVEEIRRASKSQGGILDRVAQKPTAVNHLKAIVKIFFVADLLVQESTSISAVAITLLLRNEKIHRRLDHWYDALIFGHLVVPDQALERNAKLEELARPWSKSSIVGSLDLFAKLYNSPATFNVVLVASKIVAGKQCQ